MSLVSRKRRQEELQEKTLLGKTAIAGVVIGALSLLAQLINIGFIIALNSKPVPSLVQLSDGRTIRTTGVDAMERSPAVIEQFTVRVMMLLFNMSGKLPVPNSQETIPDRGFIHTYQNQQVRVATTTWQGSLALDMNFRYAFLYEISKITPPTVFNGTGSVVFIPQNVTEIKKLETGKWRVTLISSIAIFLGTVQQGEVIPFNKYIYVRAVMPPELTTWSSDMERAIAEVRQMGLEIYAITDMETPRVR